MLRNQYRTLWNESEALEPQDDWGFIQDVVAPAPPPVAAPVSAPDPSDWQSALQATKPGWMLQAQQRMPASAETGEAPGPLEGYLFYDPTQTAVGQQYQRYSPTGEYQGVGQFKDVGGLGDILKTAATDLAPLATFALGVGPLGGMLGSAVAGGLGIPVATTAGAAGLSAAQVAALGSAAGSAGLGVLQGKPIGDVLEDAAKAVLPSLISTGLKLPDSQIPGVKEIVGNAFPDSVSDAVVRGAQDLASAAVKSVVTGQDLNVVNALLPSVVGEVTDVTGLPKPVVQLGIQSLLGGELTPEGIFKTIVQSAPKADIKNLKAEDEDTSPVTDTSLPAELDAAEEDLQSLFPEFEQPLLTAPADQRVEVVAPAPQYTPEVLDFIQNIVQQEAALPPETPANQQVEVTAPKAPVDVLDYLESLQPQQPTPITPIEEFKFQEANVMPEGPQQVVTTAEKEAALPEAFTQPTPQDVQEYIQSIINAEAALPVDQTVTTTGQLLPEQPFYELPEAPVVQDLYQPPGVLEGPSTIEVTGGKLPEPIYEQPPTPAPEPIFEQPPTPAPTAAPAPAPTPAAAPAPSPAAAAKKKQDDLALLMMLSAMMTPQQKQEERAELARILKLGPMDLLV